MKKIIFSILFITIFIISIPAQTKPRKTVVKKPQPIEVKETTQETNQCKLTLKDAPSLRNLKLGMLPDEVSKVLGLTIDLIDIKSFGNFVGEKAYFFPNITKTETSLVPGIPNSIPRYNSSTNDSQEIKNQPSLEGIKSLYLGFYNNVLYTINIKYDGEKFKWENLSEFIKNISPKLNLPENAWEIKEEDFSKKYGLSGENASLDCKDFSLSARVNNLVLTNFIIFREIMIKDYQITKEKERKKAEEEKRKAEEERNPKKTFKP